MSDAKYFSAIFSYKAYTVSCKELAVGSSFLYTFTGSSVDSYGRNFRRGESFEGINVTALSRPPDTN